MNVLKIFFPIFLFLKYISATAYQLFETENLEIPVILLKFPDVTSALQAGSLLRDYKVAVNFSKSAIEDVLRRCLERYPGSSYVVDIPTIIQNSCANVGNYIRSYIFRLMTSSENGLDALILNDLNEWKLILTFPFIKFLPIEIRRFSILEDAVKAYKDLDRIPFIIPRNLFNRNIKVDFVDEVGEDQGGLRNEFFSEIIEKSGLFTLNSDGFVALTPGRTSPHDLDTYEAFGFYLAKAFQNDLPIGYHLAQIIADMIKFGQLKFTNLDLLESWDS